MHDKSGEPPFRVYVATSNAGKIRDFEGVVRDMEVTIVLLPGFAGFPPAIEDGATFEENARIKAEHYSRCFPGEVVLADDSGLAVDALNGAPGVHSARYAALTAGSQFLSNDVSLNNVSLNNVSLSNSDDLKNNQLLISQLEGLPPDCRRGKFVCALAAAKDGVTLGIFHGEVCGQLLTAPRGSQGFGYDPLFHFPQLGKTFAEIPAEEKAKYSHRGKAFRQFLDWYFQQARHC
jgi:XTP/dITP diphosphohydrolase